jgi:exodeoxyribonuclease V alpha subunit
MRWTTLRHRRWPTSRPTRGPAGHRGRSSPCSIAGWPAAGCAPWTGRSPVFLAREVPDAPAPLLLAAALASHQLGRGHVCLDLAATLAAPDLALSLPPEGDDPGDPPPLPSALLGGLTLADWQRQPRSPDLVDGHAPGHTPLVLDATRLYLRRYWQYEQLDPHPYRRPAKATMPVGHGPPRDGADTAPGSRPRRTSNRRPWPRPSTPSSPPATTLDWQKAACALAARSPFAVITGGPGTGKTTTVVKLLALLQTLALGAGTAPAAHPPGRPHRQGRRAPQRIHRRAGQLASAGGLAPLLAAPSEVEGKQPVGRPIYWTMSSLKGVSSSSSAFRAASPPRSPRCTGC